MLGSILIFWAGLSLVIAILYTIALFVVINFHYEKLKEKIKRNE
jgi:coenzyme F420-reducing hydrogenase beta subunit